MASLSVCNRCGGFAARSVCPHCGASIAAPTPGRSSLRTLAGAIGGTAIAFTLMACYGSAPCDEGDGSCGYHPDAHVDIDAGADANVAPVPVLPKPTPEPSDAGDAAADADAADGAG
jgi:hypothetical protein